MRSLPLAAALTACHPAPEPCSPKAGGNVLVLVLDDMGVDTVSGYGLHPDPPSTPSLDALAARGIRFDRAYSTPLCASSRATLLTGRYGRRNGFGTNIPFDWFQAELPLSETTVAEAARDGAFHYTTAAFGKWHLMTRTTERALLHPNDQGFDHFDGTIANLTDVWDDSDGRRHDFFHWESLVDGKIEHIDGYATSHTVDSVLDALPALPEPWFVYVGLHLPHGPLHVPPSNLQQTGVTDLDPDAEQFIAMVEAMDHEIGRLLLGIPAETTIIAVGDNGTDLLYVRPPWVLQGGKSTLFEGGIRVPLLIAGPAVRTASSSSAKLVQTVDVAATIAELTCGDLGDPHDGVSLLPSLEDPDAAGPRSFVYTELFGNPGPPPYSTDLRVVLDKDYKLIRNALTGEETLHQIDISPALESGDLLATGEAPAQEHQRLSDAMDALDRELDFKDRGCHHSHGQQTIAAALACLLATRRHQRCRYSIIASTASSRVRRPGP